MEEALFRIVITEEFNPDRPDLWGKYFVRYNPKGDKPEFTNNIEEAGEFVLDFNHKDAYYGNLMALNDRFGIKGMVEPIIKE